jgi:hypothetical protein
MFWSSLIGKPARKSIAMSPPRLNDGSMGGVVESFLFA